MRRPQFGLGMLLAFVTIVSVVFGIRAARERAYRERTAAVSLLRSSKNYLIGLRVCDEHRFMVDDVFDDTRADDYHILAWGETLGRDDDVIRIHAIGNIAVSNEEMSAMRAIPTLRYLDLDRCQVTDAQMAEIGKLRSLEWLVLEKSPVGDEGVANLGPMPALRFLNLSGTRISDAAVAHFLTMRALDTLFVGGTSITDDGLCRLAGHTSLRSLVIGDNITDAGLMYLARMTALKCVSYYGASGVTSAGVARLKKLRPDLSGIWGEPLWDPDRAAASGEPEWRRQVESLSKTPSDEPAPSCDLQLP